MFEDACRLEGVTPGTLHVHNDNGPAMKGYTLAAKLDSPIVSRSFSRPHPSDDNDRR